MQFNDIYIKDRTSEFLNMISKHASGRDICKGIEYCLHILEDGTFKFEPNVMVYPDRYHRNKVYLNDIIMHIYLYHMSDVFLNIDQLDIEGVKPGHYKYMYNINHTRRKWVKIVNDMRGEYLWVK